jgi:HKD family nuclease
LDKKVIGVSIIFLCAGVVGGYFFSFNQIVTLESQINSYDISYTELSEKYFRLSTSYNNLLKEFDLLKGQVECKIGVLEDQKYYNSLITDLRNANESIYVAMYSMKYDSRDPDDWANNLIRELVDAKNRGVSVMVIIEYTTYFDSMSDNVYAYDYLSSNGVNVQLDTEHDTDHMKFVVIDGQIVYVGSHNWSESALYHNHETSVKVTSESVAQTFITYFDTIYHDTDYEELQIDSVSIDSETDTATIVLRNTGTTYVTIDNVLVNGKLPKISFTWTYEDLTLTSDETATITIIAAYYDIETFQSGIVYDFTIHTEAGGSYPASARAP